MAAQQTSEMVVISQAELNELIAQANSKSTSSMRIRTTVVMDIPAEGITKLAENLGDHAARKLIRSIMAEAILSNEQLKAAGVKISEIH